MKLFKENFTHLPLMGKIFPAVVSLRRSQLITGSLIVFVGAAVSNFGNYLYHLLMGRMLGPENYGILSSLISLTYFLGVPMGALSLLVVKNVSSLKADKKEVVGFYFWTLRKVSFFSAFLFLLVLVASFPVASLLKMNSPLAVATILFTGVGGVFLSVNLAVLQGLLKFGQLTVASIASVILKLISAVVLVYFGWGVLGAVFPFLFSSILILCFTFWLIFRFLGRFSERRQFRDSWGVVNYLIPIFFFNLAHTSLYSSDIILARHFLPSKEAGFYAALSTLGKVIFFAVSPIVTVMFPLISERHSNGGNYKRIFRLSFFLVLALSAFVGMVYLFFPKLAIRLLFGSKYLFITPYLKIFVPIFLLFALSFLMLNYFLSIKKTKAVVVYVLVALLQVLGIFLFHRSLFQLAMVSLVSMFLLFVSLLVYYFLDEKEKN
jgi:O-antigen/teichoic acid export membrane protein